MIPDAFITDQRAKVVRELPWPIPASVVLQMSDEDLDHLAAARDLDEYWSTLNDIVARIQTNSDKEAIEARKMELGVDG